MLNMNKRKQKEGDRSENIAVNKRKQEERKMGKNLPDDMIMEILSRLPAKSLYRFRCVCQSWLSRICSHFIRLNRNHQKLCLLFNDHYSVLDCYEATSCSDENPTVVKTEYPFKDSPTSFPPVVSDFAQIRTSCDSWLLLALSYPDNSTLMLLNPFTREHKIFSSGLYYDSSFFGIICYDNDYKVIQVSPLCCRSLPYFNVFSLKSNSWTGVRYLTNWNYQIGNKQGVSVNGAVYWDAVSVRPREYKHTILRFDLNGKFKEVPQLEEEFNNRSFCLGAVRGNLWLCFWASYSSLKMFEMKQSDLMDSWTQVCHIKISSVPLSMAMPLACTKKGDVILTRGDGRDLLIYNFKQDELKTLMKFKKPMFSKMATFSNSFITLCCDCSSQRGN